MSDEEDTDLDADWLEAGRLADARLARHNRSEYGERYEDERWQDAIRAAERGDNSDLIAAFETLQVTSWARRALIKLLRGYQLIKKPGGQTVPLYEEFRMNYEQAADFVRLRRRKLKQAKATGGRREIDKHARRASDALSDAASKAGIDDPDKLSQFMRQRLGRMLPTWTRED